MLKQAQQLQQKLMEEQQKLESETVTGSSGGGAVKVTINGKIPSHRNKNRPRDN